MAVRRVAPSERAYENILALIAEEGLQEGDRLPAERILCERWGISRSALRSALRELIAMHILESREGSGTYIAPCRPQSDCRGYNGFSATVHAVGKTPSSKVLHAHYSEAGPLLARHLGIAPQDEVFNLVRLRLIDGLPCMIETVSLVAALVPHIERFDFSEQSLVDKLLEVYGISLPHGEEQLSIIRVGKQEAKLLELSEGDPLYYQVGTAQTQERIPIEHFEAIIRPDRYAFFAHRTHLFQGDKIPERVIGDA